jgi:NAD(P)H-hydrate epimerase
LTGILTGLIAQHYLPLQACLLGTYLHGMAGDLAAMDTGQEALIAGDLVNYLGKAFHSVYGEL